MSWKRRVQPGALLVMAVLVLAVAALGVHGQQQKQTDAPTRPGAPDDERQVLHATSMLPLKERQQQFKFITGELAGTKTTLAVRRVDASSDEWVMELDDFNTIFLRRNQADDIVITRIELNDENKAVEYAPPPVLLAARHRPNELIEMQGAATIFDLEDGEQTRAGRYTHAVDRASFVRINTTEGERYGYMVEVDHSIDLPDASLSLTLEHVYDPDYGICYRRMKCTIEKLGLFGNTTERTLVLAEQSPRQTSMQH